MPQAHRDLITELTRRETSAIIFPRGFAKSTWEKIDALHDIVYAHESVIVYVSATLQDAGFHFESIKGELENNELLIRVFGNLVPPESNLGRKWTNKHFETTNRVNVVARGAGKGRGVNIRNSRPTKIILDDIENDESVRNPDLRTKLEQWINGVIMNSLDPMCGFVKMIGTILHPEAAIVHFYKTNGGIKRAAIENEQSIWPEYWPLHKLEEKRRKIGSLMFEQEYMNVPITGAERLVKESWIRRVPMPLRANVDAYGGLDPAISDKTTADYTVCATALRDRESGLITLGEVERGHMPFHDQILLMMRKHRSWNYIEFGIETIAFQKALKQEIDRVGPIERTYVPTKELKVDGDKTRRFMAVLPHIENGTIVFADTLPDEFFDELLAFPNGSHDDQVDAFVYAATLAMEGSAFQSFELL